MGKRIWLCILGVIVLAFAWYWFRPELLFIDRVVNETLPPDVAGAANPDSPTSDSTILVQGEFHSVAHETRGAASVHRFRDGSRVLRLTNFATSNGPDVRVVLIAAENAADSAAVTEAGLIELGPLKGNQGDQNYSLPAGVDLERYQAVVIWCHRFSVNFGTAPLSGVVHDEH